MNRIEEMRHNEAMARAEERILRDGPSITGGGEGRPHIIHGGSMTRQQIQERGRLIEVRPDKQAMYLVEGVLYLLKLGPDSASSHAEVAPYRPHLKSMRGEDIDMKHDIIERGFLGGMVDETGVPRRAFICDECGNYVTLTYYTALSHMDGERGLECPECGSSIILSAAFKVLWMEGTVCK